MTAALWAVTALHVALLAPMVSIADLFSRPISTVDYSGHYYEALNARVHLSATGAFWGFNPHWMAGYPEGVIGLIDNKLFFIVLLLAPEGTEPAVFNLTILAAICSAPLALFAAARLLGASSGAAAASALAATMATFGVPLCQAFWLAGTVSFFAASVWSVPAAAGLAVAATRGTLLSGRGTASTLLALLAVVAHPGAFFVLGPALAACALHLRVWRRPRLLAELVLLAVLLSLTVVPLFSAFSWLSAQTRPIGAGEFMQGGMLRLFDDWVSRFFDTRFGWDGGAGCLFLLLPLAVVSVLRDWRTAAERSGALALAAAAIVCFLLAYGSSWYPATRELQPYRFLIPFAFLLCVPAGLSIEHLVGAGRPWRRVVLAAAICLPAILIARESALRLLPPAALGSGDDPTEEDLVAFLARETTTADRIAVESPFARQAAFPGSERQITVQRFRLLPLRIDREFIGHGGMSSINLHRYATFSGRRLAGRPLESLDEGGLTALLERYAISWVVIVDPRTVALVSQFPNVLVETVKVGDAVVYRVHAPARSRLLEGEGQATASLDRIAVRGAHGERLVLKYHWLPTLRAVPPVPLEEAREPGAAVGFIAAQPGGIRDFDVVQ